MRLILVLILAVAVLQGARIPRSKTAVRLFKKQSGYPTGRAGHVVDHTIPLCVCNAAELPADRAYCLRLLDQPNNMQWQPIAESREKDRFERRLCGRESSVQRLKVPPAAAVHLTK